MDYKETAERNRQILQEAIYAAKGRDVNVDELPLLRINGVKPMAVLFTVPAAESIRWGLPNSPARMDT
jgi:hypothetical protein